VENNNIAAEEDMLAVLPVHVKRLLLVEARGPPLHRHVIWQALQRTYPRCFERVCVDLLRSRVYTPDYLIFHAGEIASKVLVVERGSLEYNHMSRYNNCSCCPPADLVRSAIQVGDMLAEPLVWCQWQHAGDLDSIQHTLLLELEIVLFSDLVRRYPAVKRWGMAHAIQFVEALRRSSAFISDLFDSSALVNIQTHTRAPTQRKSWMEGCRQRFSC